MTLLPARFVTKAMPEDAAGRGLHLLCAHMFGYPATGQFVHPSEAARPTSTVGGPYPMSLRHALLAIVAVEPMTG